MPVINFNLNLVLAENTGFSYYDVANILAKSRKRSF